VYFNFKCIALEIKPAPNATIDPEIIIHPDTNMISKLMIVKPPCNIDPGMIYYLKGKICKKMKGKLPVGDN
jgi:hypothetical protein